MIHPRLDELETVERDFIGRTFDPPEATAEQVDLREHLGAERPATAAAWIDRAKALALWGERAQLDEAVAAIEEAIALEPSDRAHFVAGVIARMRYDSDHRRPGDFARAAGHWATALDIGPNNYIWRRRLQQYGPRLDKPYPFYDWVPVAREEIATRGEEPVALEVEPGGAEFAAPADSFEVGPAPAAAPDPDGRIDRDVEGLVTVEATSVPPAAIPGDPVRVHVTLRPDASLGAHWNNEMGPTQLWVNAPAGWELERPLFEVELPPEETSDEPRSFEFELRLPEGASGDRASVDAYALYFVCDDATGVCMYRRQDLEVTIPVRGAEHERLLDPHRR
jgi:tetratricopeptide (TPR) repeat protein